MNFYGNLKFKGSGILRWVQRREDGTVEFLFDRKGNESSVEFAADTWAAIWKAAALLEAGAGDKHDDRTTVDNPFEDKDKGDITVGFLSISTDDQPLRFSAESYRDYDLAQDLPTILITSPGERDGIEFTLSPKAARELRDRLDKALTARTAVKALVKPKTIPASATA
jgi:hypothetical protein